MKCVQSLWTGTAMFRPTRHGMLLQTLSHCLALEYFDKVELVTDDRGLFLSEVMGWQYTSILNRLDELNEEGMLNFWARGKMLALLLQNEECVHVDNDVLLFGQLPKRIRSGRLVTERIDNPWYYRSPDGIMAQEIAGLPEGAVAYNCGMVGGVDLHLIHRYSERALNLSQMFKGSSVNGTIASMIFEQYWLGVFTRDQGVRVETMLPGWSTVADARSAKWLHLTGNIKNQPEVIHKTEKRIKRQFPEAYRKFLFGWERVQNEWKGATGDSSYLENHAASSPSPQSFSS